MDRKSLLFIGALITIGFLTYAFNLNNELFWDDDDWIIGNSNVHSLSGENIKNIFTKDILSGFGLNSNYYRPLLLISFAFNWVLHGSSPFGYHVVSNLFHIGNAILIFLLLAWALKSCRAAFIASLLWLVHPLNVEAVAYISGRGDPMSVFFVLGGFLLFIKSQSLIHNSKFLILSLLAMILAVLSRETAILFPALAMVFYLSFLIKSHITMSNIVMAFKKTLPFWGISAFYMLLRLTVLNFQNTLNFYNESNLYTEHLSYRLYTFSHALVEYFKLMFWPTGLHMERNLAVNTSLFQWPVWLGFLVVVLIIAIGWYFYRSQMSKWPSGKSMENGNWKMENSNFKIWFFAWSWFFIAIAPVSGIIPINAIMYEHWLYLPLIGLVALVGFYLDRILSFLKDNKFVISHLSLVIALVAYLSFFSIATMSRNLAWGNKISFYEDILKYNPDTVRVINNLGNAYSAKGDLEKAAGMYEKAIQLPDGQMFAQPYYNLANVYRDQKRPQEASEMYKKAIEVDPSFPFAYKNLAILYAQYGYFQEAINVLNAYKKIWPDDPAIDEAIRRLMEDLKNN